MKHCCITLSECFVRVKCKAPTTSLGASYIQIPFQWNLEHQSHFVLPSPAPFDVKSTFHCGILLSYNQKNVFVATMPLLFWWRSWWKSHKLIRKYLRHCLHRNIQQTIIILKKTSDTRYLNRTAYNVSVQSCTISRLLSLQSDVFGETQVRHIICTHPFIKCITRDDNKPYQWRKLWTSSFSHIPFFPTRILPNAMHARYV